MAKMRWRRRGRVGEEGTSPATDPFPEAAEGEDVLEDDAPEDAGEPDTLEDAQPDEAEAEDDEAEAEHVEADDADLEEAEPDDADLELEDVERDDTESPDDSDDGLADVDEDADSTPAKESRLVRWLLGGNSPDDVLAIQLLKAAHAKQAITMALAVAVAAVISGRPAREAAVVLGTVLLGQAVLGLHNDIVDRQRDHAHGLTGKPLAMGRLSAETAWYAVITLFLALLPLSFLNSIPAASWYLGSVVVGMVGNILFRTGFFSWWSWAVSFGMLPFFLSYGGWGGEDAGDPPQVVMVVLAAALGIGVHFMRAVWGLVADHEDNWTYLPLKLGMKIGATRLLALSTLYTIAILIGIAIAGAQVGLRA